MIVVLKSKYTSCFFLWAYCTKTTQRSLHKTLVDGLGPENTSLTFSADLGSGMDAGISSCFFKMGCFFCFVFFFWHFWDISIRTLLLILMLCM